MTNEPYYAADYIGNPGRFNQEQSQPTFNYSKSDVPKAVSLGMVLTSPYERNDPKSLHDTYASMEDNPDSQQLWTKGEKQPKRLNDLLFAILFYVQLICMFVMGCIYIPPLYNDIQHMRHRNRQLSGTHSSLSSSISFSISPKEVSTFLMKFFMNRFSSLLRLVSPVIGSMRNLEDLQYNTDDADYDDNNKMKSGENDFFDNEGVSPLDVNKILFAVSIAGLVGLIIAGLALPFIISFSNPLLQFSLLWNVFVAFLLTIVGIWVNIPILGLAGTLLFVFLASYAYSGWVRIPFAASNLVTAATAVRQNLGLIFYAYFSIIVLFGYSIVWSLISTATLYAQGKCSGIDCENDVNIFLAIALLTSLYWTHQVIKNVLHVLVAGTVGSWCYIQPQTSSCCSEHVMLSWEQATWYSFGSICFGSILVTIIQVMKGIKDSFRPIENSICCCCADFIERLAEHFNQWAFVFIAIYRYNFMEAGSNVTNLFNTRGWTVIIADSLVENTLIGMSIGVGFITGSVAVIVDGIFEPDLGNVLPFTLGSSLGFILTR